MKKYFSLFLFFALNFYFSQQTEGLRIIKAKYDIQIQNIENNYADAIKGTNRVECRVYFIIEKDGSITSVKASGSNEQFNRQAELCVLLTETRNQKRTAGKGFYERSISIKL
ncbi:hypothetical protein [Chryseobacterium sp. RU33C]|uniref:hypothetical protein n=1 Tax=Chryseobacterium sp. RU33C TaxID=1907398 RepID=UPI000955DD57|nr:hypothetical protein [Chryseobacterium sp. RU33C]SIQ96104.1 hypothetical protein SAMN05880573_11333 [Chryseobacterium sp. RU33C]